MNILRTGNEKNVEIAPTRVYLPAAANSRRTRFRLYLGVTSITGLRFIGFVLAFTLPLGAQEYQVREHQLGAYKGTDKALRAVTNHCDAVDDSVKAQGPRIFAEFNIDPTTKSKRSGWTEFASKETWEAAGKPGPPCIRVESKRRSCSGHDHSEAASDWDSRRRFLNGSTTAAAPTPS
jgi:hypothetical protein